MAENVYNNGSMGYCHKIFYTHNLFKVKLAVLKCLIMLPISVQSAALVDHSTAVIYGRRRVYNTGHRSE
jgi:hypothetical protein